MGKSVPAFAILLFANHIVGFNGDQFMWAAQLHLDSEAPPAPAHLASFGVRAPGDA